jgi:coenzyme F420 hydrogenase subunit beta
VQVHFGHAVDTKVRYFGASGGVITALLCFLLEKKLVDKVLVVMMKGLAPKAFLAQTREAVVSASGSVYFKTFSLQLIPKIVKNKRVAIVGLPCQLSAFTRLYGRLRNTLLVGLVCHHVNENWYIQHLVIRHLPHPSTPLFLGPRREGWPGDVRILYYAEGRVQDVRVPLSEVWGPVVRLHFSTPLGCLFCADHLAKAADLVIGDAWHSSYAGRDQYGTSMIVVRTNHGLQCVRRAEEARQIDMTYASLGDFVSTVRVHIEGLRFVALRRHLHNRTYFGEECFARFSLVDSCEAVLALICNHLGRYGLVRRMLLSRNALRILHLFFRLRRACGRRIGWY